MRAYGSVVVYCAESEKDATIKVLESKGHSWQCIRTPFGEGHRLEFHIPVTIKVEDSLVVPA